jgi:hypothetical protein
MTLAIEIRNGDHGTFCPIVVCDGCQEAITDGHSANVLHGEDGHPLLFLHKECPDGAHRDNSRLLWMDLDAWYVFLGRNLHIKATKAAQSAAIHGMFL